MNLRSEDIGELTLEHCQGLLFRILGSKNILTVWFYWMRLTNYVIKGTVIKGMFRIVC